VNTPRGTLPHTRLTVFWVFTYLAVSKDTKQEGVKRKTRFCEESLREAAAHRLQGRPVHSGPQESLKASQTNSQSSSLGLHKCWDCQDYRHEAPCPVSKDSYCLNSAFPPSCTTVQVEAVPAKTCLNTCEAGTAFSAPTSPHVQTRASWISRLHWSICHWLLGNVPC
jgi:hypothetical protein